MDFLRPRTLEEALVMKAGMPEALPIAGGTDVMVGVNFGHSRPPALLDVSRLPELQTIRRERGEIFVGAGVTYSRIVREMPDLTPLVQAARSVGSPQIRHRGTIGGNLGTASPAGDALPVLAAYEAQVELVSARGSRSLAWHEFLTGPKRNALLPDELIAGARWTAPSGPGSFSKVGSRNAMIIAVIGLCLVVDESRRSLRVALGSVGPTILRVPKAEELVARELERAGVWDDPRSRLAAATVEQFGELVAGAASPIDDVRGTVAYRRHACQVLARRALTWALDDRRRPAAGVA